MRTLLATSMLALLVLPAVAAPVLRDGEVTLNGQSVRLSDLCSTA